MTQIRRQQKKIVQKYSRQVQKKQTTKLSSAKAFQYRNLREKHKIQKKERKIEKKDRFYKLCLFLIINFFSIEFLKISMIFSLYQLQLFSFTRMMTRNISFICLVIALLGSAIYSSILPCISRDTIIARGQNWVDLNISYSQSSTYDGYRTDCSGFVSMCWNLTKPGRTTETLGLFSTQITKETLQRGDAILCPGTHVVLFVEWVNSTHYIGMQQTSAKNGTIKRKIPYPFWTNPSCYFPIKYNGVC